jgi:hypothetical protein
VYRYIYPLDTIVIVMFPVVSIINVGYCAYHIFVVAVMYDSTSQIRASAMPLLPVCSKLKIINSVRPSVAQPSYYIS